MAIPRIGRSIDVDKVAAGLGAEHMGSVAVRPMTVDEAGELLLTYLPEDTQVIINEAAVTLGYPVWQMLLGYAMKTAERFELFSPIMMGTWQDGGRPNLPRPCGTCGIEFSTRYPDGKYCCELCFFQKGGHTKDCPTQVKVGA